MVENMDNFELAPPVDLSHHFSAVTKRRVASKIKAFYKYFTIPGIANLAGGLPAPEYFPFDDLEAKSALPHRFKPTSNTPVDPPSASKKHKHNAYLNDPTQTRVTVPHASSQPNRLERIDLNTALQYGTAQGYPPLYAFIREFALTRLHPNIPYKDGGEVILTCGSTDGFAKILECFTNIWTPDSGKPLSEREGLLCEEFAYMNALQTARPRGMSVTPVAIDAEGMLAYGHPKCLYNVLSNWDVEKDGGKRPHIIYTVTMGQNPTSGLLSVKRRKEIYEICQKFDVLIAEDDPYFYIQFPHAANDFSQKHRNGQIVSMNHFAENNLNYQTSLRVPVRGIVKNSNGYPCTTTRMRKGKSSGSEFLDSLVPSYLSIDVDGRVIRMDTFSKTIAPGCRLGWLTAQPAIIEKILRITETSTQQPSGFVQSLVAEMLIGPDKYDFASSGKGSEKPAAGWKMDGWIRWLEGLRGNYERRMRIMCEVLEEGKYVATSGPSQADLQEQEVQARTRRLVQGVQAARRQRLNRVIACSYARTNAAELANPTIPSTTIQDFKSTPDDDDAFEVLTKTQIYDFVPPMAGMFLWLHLRLETHPLFSSFPHDQFSHALWIFQTRDPYKVLVAPGTMFAPTQEIQDAKGWQYYRLCFAAVNENDIRAISENFVKCCHDFWQIKDKKVIQDMLDEDESGQVSERVQELMKEGTWTVSPVMC
ncbi:hypothetical protein LTR05_002353 [Lithohypha guttulata]|uniref:Aromatic amino acid aminotransferase n=1 Tax=Lithohypha guttulata TaxID=1690604 RepID=A0AAN7T267_9EURO|nr:hypothetical protein LTR05_002353 [Lithohypha guttulata]